VVRYKRNIGGGTVRIPKEVRESLGDNIEMLPNKISMVMYPAGEDKRKVIRSLKVIISDLMQDVEEESHETRSDGRSVS